MCVTAVCRNAGRVWEAGAGSPAKGGVCITTQKWGWNLWEKFIKEVLFRKIRVENRNWFDFCGSSERKKKVSDFEIERVTEKPIPTLEEKMRSSLWLFKSEEKQSLKYNRDIRRRMVHGTKVTEIPEEDHKVRGAENHSNSIVDHNVPL